MSFLNTIIELEGPVVNVRPRCWAAHRAAAAELGFDGVAEDEFWRLLRTGTADGMFLRQAKPAKVAEYARRRAELLESSELMQLDTAQPAVHENLRVLKSLGNCHLVTLAQNRDAVNATINRLELWLYFDQKRSLPSESDHRVAALKELAGLHHSSLVVAGSVPLAYAAGEAGCHVVALRNGLAFPKFFQQVGVDVCYDDIEELTDALTRRAPELQKIGLL